MQKLTHRALVLSLIKDDLINSKMVNGLNEIGLNADKFSLHLSDTIFKLMGFEENEETEVIFEHYIELSKRSMYIDISQSYKALDDLAMQIYIELSSKRIT